ncbi:type II secretion system protein GspL [Paraherbaspirillum soli]|uniref:Type II secretion system protein GspL n=1 Tax=Paraherbaspirillum soli TaxID=631222 RepID=A0ABW0M5Y4_9BURK
MTTLFIRLPSRATLDSAAAVTMPACLFALVGEQGKIERQGCEPLSSLAALIAGAGRVVLILAAADVSLLRLPVPPLSAAKLKAALPNLVEEQLLSDPLDCVIVAGRRVSGSAAKNEATDNLRLIAVVQRDWLELLVKTLLTLGARNLQALPAQLCLPWRDDVAVAAVSDHEGDINVAVRLSGYLGIGWSVYGASAEATAQEIVDGLAAIVPQQAITLYVPAASQTYYQELDPAQLSAAQLTIMADDWSQWVSGAQEASRTLGIDLMSGLTASAAGTEFSWRRWRWPLALAAALLCVNVFSLNYDWWRLRHESNALRADMQKTYRAAYPKETVVVDPIAQMKQKIALAERENGQVAADDFIALAAHFGEALATLPQVQTSEKGIIAGLEYRDHHLLVRLKNAADANTFSAQIKPALEASGLTLTQPTAGVWQIGSRK